VNITIKITHVSGTVTEVSIPMGDSVAVSMPSAPVTPVAPQVASEPAIPAADEGDNWPNDYEILHGDLLPGKKRYASVQDMLDGKEIVRSKHAEEIEEGEVGGEEGGCKGEEGEKEGKRKEKPDPELAELEREAELNALEDSRDLCEIEFRTKQGAYRLEPSFVHDLLKVHDDPFLRRELIKAKLWLEAHPHKAKSMRGMKSYINSWMNRAAETLAFLQHKAVVAPPKRQEPGSLLAAAKSEVGW
jgi:hypothetical protein